MSETETPVAPPDPPPTITKEGEETTAPPTPPVGKNFILVNGINTSTDNLDGWHFAAEDYIESHSPWQANTYHYHERTLFRWMKQGKHIEQLALKMARRTRPEHRIIMVGHSNGCALICGVLRKFSALRSAQEPGDTNVAVDLRVSEVHLIAAAEDDDCRGNGINDAVACGLVDRIVMYVSPVDRALKAAKKTHWIKHIYNKWGYGYMGLSGPKNLSEAADKIVRVEEFPHHDHATYFDATHFEATMRMVMYPAE